MTFRHDSTGVEDSGGTRLVLPDGWYMLKITEAEELKSKKKGYDMILCKCSPVNNDEFKDASIRHYVVFIPKGEKGDGISVHFRKCIGVAYGGNDNVEADDWIGRKFRAKVASEDYTNSDGKTFKNNKIVEVASLIENNDDEVPF